MMNTKRLYVYSLICKFLPPSKFNRFKSSLLRWCGAKVGENVEIMSSAKIMGNMDLEIGNYVFIGHDALIFGAQGSRITIGDYAKIGSRSVLVTGYHRITPDGPCIRGEGMHDDIIIEQGAAISTMCMINPGKKVGKMSFVMAGSIVTHDVPEYTQVAGIPAREVKRFK